MQDRFLRVKDTIKIYYKLTCCLIVVQSHSEHLPKSWLELNHDDLHRSVQTGTSLGQPQLEWSHLHT